MYNGKIHCTHSNSLRNAIPALLPSVATCGRSTAARPWASPRCHLDFSGDLIGIVTECHENMGCDIGFNGITHVLWKKDKNTSNPWLLCFLHLPPLWYFQWEKSPEISGGDDELLDQSLQFAGEPRAAPGERPPGNLLWVSVPDRGSKISMELGNAENIW